MVKRYRIIALFLALVVSCSTICLPVYGENIPTICGEKDHYRMLSPSPIPDLEILGLQKRLQELGYYAGKLNGIFGPVTLKAVKTFKRDYQLSTSEVIDEDTWRALAETYEITGKVEPDNVPPGQVSLIIDFPTRKLTVMSDGQPFRSFIVAIGSKRTPTPIGEWRITSKGLDWGGGFGTRWIGLDVPWGIYGIHGTDKPWLMGQAASHGCIRMKNRDVESLYKMVYPGMEVKIEGSLPPKQKPLILRKGQASQDVVALQLLLRQAEVFSGRADGRFGAETEAAVKMFEEKNQLPIDGIAEPEIWRLLHGLKAGDSAKETPTG